MVVRRFDTPQDLLLVRNVFKETFLHLIQHESCLKMRLGIEQIFERCGDRGSGATPQEYQIARSIS